MKQSTVNKGRFTKGRTAWNKGMRGFVHSGSFKLGHEAYAGTEKTRFKKGQFLGESHPNWKGDRVGYSGLHKWVTKQLGRPSKCDFCKSTTAKKYEWANKSGLYRRDLQDWLRLCSVCHHDQDGRIKVKEHEISKIKQLYYEGLSQRVIAKLYSVTPSNISKIVNERSRRVYA